MKRRARSVVRRSGSGPRRSTAVQRKVTGPRQAKVASGVSFIGSPDWRQVIQLTTGADPRAPELTAAISFATSAYCYTAMGWRAQSVSSAPMMVVRETEDGDEWQPDHPLAELLDSPRPDIDMGEMLQRTQMYRDWMGAALWVLDKDQGGVFRLVTPFSASEFEVAAKPPFIYGTYKVRTRGGGWKPVPRENVVHFRDLNPNSWTEPLGKVDVAVMQLDLGHQVNRIVRQLLTKALFPGGIISPDKDWKPTVKEWEAYKIAAENWYTVAAAQGTPLIVPGSTSVSTIARNMGDLLPEAVLDRVEATIGGVFGVPPVVLGWLSGMKNSPWSQMTDARRQAFEDTIVPLWSDIASRCGRTLLTEDERSKGLAIRFDTSKVLALRDDDEKKARVAALNADSWTVDERRIFTGQEPLNDERGDTITGLPSVAASGGDVTQLSNPLADLDLKSDEPAMQWLVFDLSTKAQEPGWVSGVFAYLQSLKTLVVKEAERLLREEKADNPVSKDSADNFERAAHDLIKRDEPRLLRKVHPLVTQTGTTAVRRLGAKVGISFRVLQPGLSAYAKEEAHFLASVMGKTTATRVVAAVQAGLNAGDTVRGLIKRLEDLPAFDRDRAKMVARTETTRAWNGAQRRSMSEYEKSTGKQVTKTWLNSGDDRVRDEHLDQKDGGVGGETVGVNEEFSNGLLEPGEPNCRCTLLYAIGDEEPVEAAP